MDSRIHRRPGRLIVKDVIMLAAAVVTLADSAKTICVGATTEVL
jgi:uncharacterized membrane protein YkgB